jgi:hypothetical protein
MDFWWGGADEGGFQKQWIRLISIAYCKVGEGWSIIRQIASLEPLIF